MIGLVRVACPLVDQPVAHMQGVQDANILASKPLNYGKKLGGPGRKWHRTAALCKSCSPRIRPARCCDGNVRSSALFTGREDGTTCMLNLVGPRWAVQAWAREQSVWIRVSIVVHHLV